VFRSIPDRGEGAERVGMTETAVVTKTDPPVRPGTGGPAVDADLSWPLERAAEVAGKTVAVVDGATRLTYADFLDHSRRIGAELLRRGVLPGDRVAVLGANSAAYLAAYFGVPAAGFVLVPLNGRLVDAELAAVIGDCAPALLVVDGDNAERGSRLAGPDLPVVTFDDLTSSSADGEERPTASADDLAAIFYTGGSTGRAKGVMLSHRNLTANSLHMIAGLGYRPDDVYLHCAPMFHLGDGMSTYPLTWVAARHVVLPRFDAAAVAAAIESERVTCTFLVPTMLTLLLEHLSGLAVAPDLSSLRLIVHGGAPISASLLDRAMRRLGCSFTQSYGMTEAGPILSFLQKEEEHLGEEVLRSAGQPVVGVQVRVVRPDGEDCAVGEVGEIVARGPNISTGYWRQPDITRERFQDGWYRSGDLAYRDETSHLYIVGRAAEVIISGGENVYAAEVEAALARHDDVVEAAVIAVPSPRWGEQVHAAVAVRPGTAVTADDLDRHCRDLIAGYKVPRSYEFHPVLPRTGTEKIDKPALRAPHWAGAARGVS
jgi:long-chain acyl-CoA synthetase